MRAWSKHLRGRLIRLKLLGLGEGGIGFGGPSKDLKRKTFAIPGHRMVGVLPNRLVIGFDGLVILALDTEGAAFDAPGINTVGI